MVASGNFIQYSNLNAAIFSAKAKLFLESAIISIIKNNYQPVRIETATLITKGVDFLATRKESR